MQNSKSTNKESGKTIIGFILLAVGCILLLKTFDLPFFPSYLISWPMILIIIGLYIGARKGYHKPAAFVLILLGVVFWLGNIPGWDISGFLWPLSFIAFGLWIILKPRLDQRHQNIPDWDKRIDPVTGEATSYETNFDDAAQESNRNMQDYLNTTSIFGAVKKTVVSKNFKGGEVVNFFGGAELNLIQADIQGRVKLEVTQVFGGTKIIIPANWTIHSEMVAVFGGIEDKRLQPTEANPDKVLIIEGTSVFGGIDIRSF